MAKSLWLDYSFARPSVANMKALGYEGVMRYLSLDPSKNLSKSEAAELRAAGLKIGLVWETTATRAGQGRAAGAADAKAANAQADALGYPDNAVIFYAVDFDATPAQVQQYFEAVKATPGRPVGLYGGIKLTAIGLASYNWQTVAWSDGNVDGKANLYQRLTPTVKGAPPGTDENVLLNAFPAWGSARPAPKPKPAPKPTPKPQPKPDPGPHLVGPVVIGWNCYVANNSTTVRDTLVGWANEHKPAAFMLSEARTHASVLGSIPGYRLYQQKPQPPLSDGTIDDQGDSAILLNEGLLRDVKHHRVAKMLRKWKVVDPKHPHTHTPRQYEVLTLHTMGHQIRLRASHFPTHGLHGANAKAWVESARRAKAWSLFGLRSVSLDVGDFNEQQGTVASWFGKRFWVSGNGIDLMVARNVKDVKVTELDKGGSDHHGQLYFVTL